MKWSTRGVLALGTFLAVATGATATSAGARNFADDSQIAVLQQVIQHSNEEQMQAIATSNVSLVADTVTGAYAQQLGAALREMLDNHVTGITLVNLQWGGVTVAADGTRATVTTFETWRVVSTAGTVDDEPTRNDYTLVMDGAVWKITSDTQTVGAPTPVVTNTPLATPTVPTATPTVTDTPTPTPTAVPTNTPTPQPQDVPSPEPQDGPSPEPMEAAE